MLTRTCAPPSPIFLRQETAPERKCWRIMPLIRDVWQHPDQLKKADNLIVPNCIFTDPEIASVGLNEEQAAAKGLEVEIKKFDFLGSGMARILDEAEGFIKVISDKKTDEVLGACMIGPKATELIAVLTLAVSNHLKSASIRNTIFAHPTLSESIHEAVK